MQTMMTVLCVEDMSLVIMLLRFMELEMNRKTLEKSIHMQNVLKLIMKNLIILYGVVESSKAVETE